ncbi:hypothetical protein DBV15_05461 [Temnothorax longispinosus]|uniref:Uncharacterized protein n=1 Tax=Temnothorax longispinosus TaxID=300112 RepID=A0A4S2KYB1_9HYME|nr:hypothetical protein DBV15_05461 [Temnothorax longispinosus]
MEHSRQNEHRLMSSLIPDAIGAAAQLRSARDRSADKVGPTFMNLLRLCVSSRRNKQLGRLWGTEGSEQRLSRDKIRDCTGLSLTPLRSSPAPLVPGVVLSFRGRAANFTLNIINTGVIRVGHTNGLTLHSDNVLPRARVSVCATMQSKSLDGVLGEIRLDSTLQNPSERLTTVRRACSPPNKAAFFSPFKSTYQFCSSVDHDPRNRETSDGVNQAAQIPTRYWRDIDRNVKIDILRSPRELARINPESDISRAIFSQPTITNTDSIRTWHTLEATSTMGCFARGAHVPYPIFYLPYKRAQILPRFVIFLEKLDGCVVISARRQGNMASANFHVRFHSARLGQIVCNVAHSTFCEVHAFDISRFPLAEPPSIEHPSRLTENQFRVSYLATPPKSGRHKSEYYEVHAYPCPRTTEREIGGARRRMMKDARGGTKRRVDMRALPMGVLRIQGINSRQTYHTSPTGRKTRRGCMALWLSYEVCVESAVFRAFASYGLVIRTFSRGQSNENNPRSSIHCPISIF